MEYIKIDRSTVDDFVAVSYGENEEVIRVYVPRTLWGSLVSGEANEVHWTRAVEPVQDNWESISGGENESRSRTA